MSDSKKPLTGTPHGAPLDVGHAAYGAPGPQGGTQDRSDGPAAADGVEDTRAVMSRPSQSEDHAMPGEAVPAAESAPAAQPRLSGDADPAAADGGEDDGIGRSPSQDGDETRAGATQDEPDRPRRKGAGGVEDPPEVARRDAAGRD